MPPRASPKAFLATARAALTAPPSKRARPLTFVVGNESADLDSLCSALLLAYFHTYAPPKNRASVDGSSAASSLHIPICHLQRADLALRPEFAAVLRDADIAGEDMFTLEDVLPHRDGDGEGIRPEDTRWLLVDHNAMTGTLASRFATRVFGCVDHHADEHVIPRDADPRVIERSGSCMSLVLERCADSWRASTGESVEEVDAQLARLALAPILIDTANLGDKNKTTEHDERAVALAESKIGLGAKAEGGEAYDRDAFFKRLSALKEDIADMSFRDVFRKDYKEWGVGDLHLGTSSVPQGFAYLLAEKARGDPAALVSALREWGVEKDGGLVDGGGKMDLVVLLTTFQDQGEKFCRELLVWARSEAGIRAAELFEQTCADKLRLQTWGEGVLDCTGGGGEWWRCWAQGAVEHSRKQIAPMLRDALKEVSGRG
ncbi:exopolyphosphatase-like protein [Xylaria digitata]|nr:exopolyphosphatase-like protein [Xylaria digitata]